MADIRLEGVRKVFGGRVVAVRDLTLTFPSGSVTCLLGPSGCGKTTLMRMIAGLEEPTAGEIYFDNQRVTHLSPSQRQIGMVFQYPVVYRGITVERNIELPLMQDKRLSPAERKQRIAEVLETLDLTAYAQHDVSMLDNGTRQKVAVAREVARQPRILLFDEPVTNVDVSSKTQLKRALKRLVKQHNQTIIYVTHDQTEAMTLADEIALMRDGMIIQRGVPREIYDHPNDRFGGWFLGNPGMNFIDYRLDNGALVGGLFAKPMQLDLTADSHIVVGDSSGARPRSDDAHADIRAGARPSARHRRRWAASALAPDRQHPAQGESPRVAAGRAGRNGLCRVRSGGHHAV
jgi:ABC-type sugar transport system ATPase subunit